MSRLVAAAALALILPAAHARAATPRPCTDAINQAHGTIRNPTQFGKDCLAKYANHPSMTRESVFALAQRSIRSDDRLSALTPSDAASFCPTYARLDTPHRQTFWATLLTAITKPESDYNPMDALWEGAGDPELSIGLLQLSASNQGPYGCTFATEPDLTDPQINMACAIRIMAKTVGRDGQIGNGAGTPHSLGAASYWSTLRDTQYKRAAHPQETRAGILRETQAAPGCSPTSTGQLTTPANPLLPANQNPVQAGLPMPPAEADAIRVFDGPGEKRDYDYYDQLDGLTIAFGQWPQSEFPAFLADLKSFDSGKALTALKTRLAEFYAANPQTWQKVPHQTGTPTQASITALLENTIYSEPFMAKYRANCSKDAQQYCLAAAPSFYRDSCNQDTHNTQCAGQTDWLGTALRYALRDYAVVAWEVDYWNRYLLVQAAKDAAAINLEGTPGMIALASMRSSAPSYAIDFVQAAKTGNIHRGGHDWSWTTPPHGADLQSWRLLTAWQYYNTIKGRIRGRSQLFYQSYLAAHWDLPAQQGRHPDWNSPQNSNPTLVRWH